MTTFLAISFFQIGTFVIFLSVTIGLLMSTNWKERGLVSAIGTIPAILFVLGMVIDFVGSGALAMVVDSMRDRHSRGIVLDGLYSVVIFKAFTAACVVGFSAVASVGCFLLLHPDKIRKLLQESSASEEQEAQYASKMLPAQN